MPTAFRPQIRAIATSPQAPRLLIDGDRDRKALGAGTVARAAYWGGAERIEPNGDAHVGIGRADAVCGIEADPAQIGDEGFGPGVARLLLDGAVGEAKIAGDITSGDRKGVRRADEDMSEVLAYARLSAKASAAPVAAYVALVSKTSSSCSRCRSA
ncbi:MAG: hypothetical protein ABSC37_17455 [Xanthobacteraceae bacterium]